MIEVESDDGSPRRWAFDRQRLVGVVTAVAFVLVGLMVGSSATTWWAARAVGNTPSAKAENVLLKSRLTALEARLGRVDRALARVASYDAKIRQLTQEDRGARAFGIGPLSELEVAAAERERRAVALPGGELPPAPHKSDLQAVLGDLDDRSLDLESRALKEEVSLQEIRGYLDDRTSLVNAYPSEWPVRGWVTSMYGWRTSPHSGARRLHTGLDIAAPRGTPIVAAADGHVVFAGYHSAYGNLVVIDHGYGITTKHAHTSRILVRVGDRVIRGDVIARVGNTGRSTGPHLHFELLQDGVPVNPLPFLRSE